MTFDFDRAHERAAVGHLLGPVVDRAIDATQLMLSALVHNLEVTEPAPAVLGVTGGGNP